MTPRALAVDAATAAGSPLSLRPELLRRPIPPSRYAFSPRFRPHTTFLSSSPPPRAAVPPVPPLPRFAASAPPHAAAHPISVAAAPQATARRPNDRLRQVSTLNPLAPTAVAPSSPASSIFTRHLTRARRRRTDHGGATATHHSTPLVAAMPLVPSPTAAVAGGGESCGRARRRAKMARVSLVGSGRFRSGSSLNGWLESNSNRLEPVSFRRTRLHPIQPNNARIRPVKLEI
jgi:hypothetical protein